MQSHSLENQKRYTIGCITSSISYNGGWDTLSKGIIGAVAKKHNVIILTARDAKNDSVPYPIKCILPKKYIAYSFWNQFVVCIMALIFLRKSDAIHVFIEPFGPGAALAAKILRVPFFITIAGTYCVIPKGNQFRERMKRVLMKFMYKEAAFIATGSHRNIELIEEIMPLEGKWKFVPFGVDLEKYGNGKIYPKPARPFLLTVGAVKPRKGALYTVRALGLLKDEFPDLCYKIGGSFVETPYVQSIRDAIREEGLDGRVELMGRISDEKLIELYATCTVFVLAAQTVDGAFEGFPMVFYEAHSLGAPVISTYGFGSEYVIKNGGNGFLVSQENVVELAHAIKKIVENPELREAMSRQGQAEAQKHSWDDIGVYYTDAYKTILTKRI